MRDYEMMCILDPSLDDDGTQGAGEKVQSLVSARGAQVEHMEPWGRRKLAYPIRKFQEGNYLLLRFKMEPQQATELDRTLKLNESVLRHLLIRRDSRTEVP